MSDRIQLYELIKELSERKIKIWLEEESLKFKAPKDALDADLKNRMVYYKQEIIAFLKEQQQSQSAILPRTDKTSLPLSHAQRRLWFIDQYSELNQKSAYNIPVVLEIVGELDIPALEQAINKLIERHEVLQTSFENHKGLPKQSKNKYHQIKLKIFDLTSSDELEQNNRAKQIIEENLSTIFDLNQWPLFKPELIKLQDQKFIFLASMHHIIADGWSMNIVIKEIALFYQSIVGKQNLEPSPLEFQYADFANWQSQQKQEYEKCLSFWKEYLHDSSILELPLDRKRLKNSQQTGSHSFKLIEAELHHRLNELATKQGVTLFMLLVSAFNILLSRFSRQKDINVGVPVANRNRKEWEPLIGFFVNSLVLRSNLEGNPTFTELLAQVQTNTLAIYSNQDVPFDMLVDAMQAERESLHTPLFQVMFNLHSKTDQNTLTLPNLEISVMENSNDQARYDMTWSLSETKSGIVIDLEYRSDLFEQKTIDSYLNYFSFLLAEIVAHPDCAIEDYQLQANEITLAQQLEFNPEEVLYPHNKTIYSLFSETAKFYPNQIAISSDTDDLCDEPYHVSYQQLYKQVEMIAAHLQKHGLRPESRILLLMPRSLSMLQAILASLKLGACYIPVDPEYPDERKLFIAEDARAELLITSKRLREQCFVFQKCNVRCIYIEDLLEQEIAQTVKSYEISDTQNLAACVFYTSGSTGQPKGVIVPHRAIVRLVRNNWFYDFNQHDVCGHISNVSFDASSMEIWGALLNGGRVHIVRQNDLLSINSFSRLIEQQNISVMFLSMGLFRLFAQERSEMFGSMKCLLIGGEAVDLNAARAVTTSLSPPLQLMNGYGPTENATFSACYLLNYLERGLPSAPLGKSISHSKVFICDDKGNLLPPGIPGELICAGDGLAIGYLNNDALTREKFVTGFITKLPDVRVYKTGDVARYRYDGNIILSGRLDEQIKLRGFRIEPSEIENFLETLSFIHSACVTVKQNPVGERHLVAYVVLGEIDNADWKSAIKEAMQANLPAFMTPAFFEVIDKLPVNANGKVDKRILPEPDWAQTSDHYQAPLTQVEKQLAQLWCEVLALDKVSRHANFFEIGGHSLLATRLASRINEYFNVDVRVKEIFSNPSIEQLAHWLSLQGIVSSEEICIPVLSQHERDAGVVLSKAQQRLWFIHQLDPQSSAYGMPMAVRLLGNLDVKHLEQCMAQLMERHESLRTIFKSDHENLAKQFIKKNKKFELTIQECISDDEIAEEIALNQKLSFDLEQGPLFCVKLLKINQKSHVLLMNMHHIISDGWSMQILQHELLALYQNRNIEPLPIQYVDYSAWQVGFLSEEKTRQLLSFWIKYLEGVPHFLSMPLDHARPKQQSFKGALCHYQLNNNIQSRAFEFCQQYEVSSFVLGLACYALLLSKYSNQNDFCIGIPVSGREHKQLEGLIGFFVNGIVIRSDLRERMTVKEMLASFKQKSLKAFEHQDLSADLLVEAMNVQVNNQYQPLAQVAFSHLAVTPISTEEANGVHFEVIESINHSAKYDLMFSLTDTGKALDLSCEYATDLFEPSTINRMLAHFENLLDQMLLASDTPVQELDLYSQKEISNSIKNNNQLAEIETAFPLSFNQQAIYLDWQINPLSKQNSIANFLEINEAIDTDLWQQCFESIQQKHQVFRTSFVHIELPGLNRDFQLVSSLAPQAFNYEDLSDRQLDFEHLIQLVEDKAYCSYDLANDVPYHYTLFKLSENKYVGMLRAHHIIFDGISGRIFLEEIAKLYESRASQTSFKFETDRFNQFVQLENFQIDKQATLDFWRKKSQFIEALNFDSCVKQEPRFESVYQELKFSFCENETREIKLFCKKNGITPAIFFKSIYAALIFQYCRVEADFVIKEYAHGRPSGFENSYGVYYQQTPFIVSVDFFNSSILSTESFKHFFLYAKNYQKEIKDKRNLSLQSQVNLFPQGNIGFMYNYTRFEADIDFMGRQLATRFLSPRAEGQVQLFIRENKQNFECILIFSEHFFSELGFLQRIHAISQALIHEQEPNLLLGNDIEAYKRVNRGYTHTSDKLPGILKNFSTHAQQQADVTAIITKDSHITYKTLENLSNQLAVSLTSLIQQKGLGRIAILSDFNFEFVASVFAICKSGLSYLPLSIDIPQERLINIMQQAGISALITREQYIERFDSVVFAQIPLLLDLDKLPMEEEPGDAFEIRETNALYTIFTSGSTGTPKGAQVSYKGVQNLLYWYENILNINSSDVSLIISSPGFDLTQKNLFAFLRNGASIVLPQLDIFDPQKILELITQHQVTHINCAPSAFYALLQQGEHYWHMLSSLRWVVLGGEAIKIHELTAWYNSEFCQACIMNSYGPTECTDVVAYYMLTQDDFDEQVANVPLGQAIDEAQLYVVNQNHELLIAGLVGQIAIGGTCLGLGYLEQAKLNKSQFVDIETPSGIQKVYLTGDLGYINNDNLLMYVGRIDFQLKLRGQRLEAGEIENNLRQHESVHDALVDVVNEQLVSWIVPEHAQQLDTEQLRKHQLQSLPGYMIPVIYICVEKWPLNANGKINRAALPVPDFSSLGKAERILPRTEIEQTLADIWCEVLALNEVGINESFFELGGHSLLATRIVNRIKQTFELDIQLRALFDLHTIADLAQYIKNLQWAVESQQKAERHTHDEASEQDAPQNREEGFL